MNVIAAVSVVSDDVSLWVDSRRSRPAGSWRRWKRGSRRIDRRKLTLPQQKTVSVEAIGDVHSDNVAMRVDPVRLRPNEP